MLKLSIALCSYNGELYLKEQLDSIASQTLPPHELVVVDDCSSDGTLEIIRDFASRVSFSVKVYVNERNLGSTKSFEKAIRLCESEIIALADQDDLWRSDKLEQIQQCFAQSLRIGIVFSDADLVDRDLRDLRRRLWVEVGFDDKKKALLRRGRTVDVLLSGWTVTGATMAFRSVFRELVLPVPTDIPMIHDGWIALMVGVVAPVTFIEEALIRYRQHQRQQVGAPARQTLGHEASSKELETMLDAVYRKNSYSDLISILEKVRERLLDRRDALKDPTILSLIEKRLKHLKSRANLPEGIVRRSALVLNELITLRYHKYSNGVSSAAKDLLFFASSSRDHGRNT
jgi:glycosyltransferase involved in cell wall biosynthesis